MRFHLQPLMIDILGFNEEYYMFTLILLTKIVLRSICFWPTFTNYTCFVMNSGANPPYLAFCRCQVRPTATYHAIFDRVCNIEG